MLIRRKTLRFPRSFLSQNVTHRIRVVKKYQDSYHCGRWLHHHNSQGFFKRSSYYYYCEKPICMRCTVTQLACENVGLCPLSWLIREGIRVITW